jgi:methionine sulfoxide reductase heme-binding subunit
VVLVVFMGVPRFDANRYAHADLTSSSLPRQRAEGRRIEPLPRQVGHHGGGRTRQHGNGAMGQHRAGRSGHGGRDQRSDSFLGLSARGFTVATGYVALGLLALTLLIGPVNLLRRQRNPVSSYLRRDVGAWTATFSVIHVIYGLRVHGSGGILNNAFFDYFIADGRPLINSFGLGNWTGLLATVIVVGLLALSSDSALRKLKARSWKRLQRLNYALFVLVAAHAFFYGALLRANSPYTWLLLLSVIAVFSGQAVGVWLYRRKHSRTTDDRAAALTP